jgi:tRNA modification GTPase
MLNNEERERKIQTYSRLNEDYIVISAKSDADTATLERKLTEAANIPQIGENDVPVTSIRHYEALAKALSAIERVSEGLEAGISGDFLSQDIRECLYYLGEITGQQIGTEEVLGNIFGKFCIGK